MSKSEYIGRAIEIDVVLHELDVLLHRHGSTHRVRHAHHTLVFTSLSDKWLLGYNLGVVER